MIKSALWYYDIHNVLYYQVNDCKYIQNILQSCLYFKSFSESLKASDSQAESEKVWVCESLKRRESHIFVMLSYCSVDEQKQQVIHRWITGYTRSLQG